MGTGSEVVVGEGVTAVDGKVGIVGATVGTIVGATVGTIVGATVGATVGANVGTIVGANVGTIVGAMVEGIGASVGLGARVLQPLISQVCSPGGNEQLKSEDSS